MGKLKTNAPPRSGGGKPIKRPAHLAARRRDEPVFFYALTFLILKINRMRGTRNFGVLKTTTFISTPPSYKSTTGKTHINQDTRRHD
jgi:hypothetical protein